jgi:hypothetical protein
MIDAVSVGVKYLGTVVPGRAPTSSHLSAETVLPEFA